jgi:hypothetical protein
MNHRDVFALFLGIAALLGAMCGDAGLPVAGPSTEQGNPQIVAVVVDDHYRPLASATVFIYKIPVYFDSTDQDLPDAILIATSPTDSGGKCSFEKLVPGIYSIKAVDADSAHSTIRTNIPISLPKPERPEYHDTLVLTAPGVIHGIVSRGGVLGNNQNQKLTDAFIQVKIGELDRFTITGETGVYSFSNLPAGTYTIYYYATDGFFSAKRESIIVRPEDTTTVDSVILKPVPRLMPPKGFTAVYDTSAELVHFYWQKVNYDGLRYYIVERKCISDSAYNKLFTTADTVLTDSLTAILPGTVLYYVIRSIDQAFNASWNAGAIEITVAEKK